MSSAIPTQCCTTGTIYTGNPKGYMTVVNGKFDAYISDPPTAVAHKDCGVLYLPDAFGIWQNSKLMADKFAAKGYTCVVLDIFNGDALKPNNVKHLDVSAWLRGGSSGDNPHTPEYIDPIVVAGINFMRDLGFARIGAVGYCFGAKYVIRHCVGGISCGYIAHPYGLEEAELSAASAPISIAAAEKDTAFTAEMRYRAEDILRKSKQSFQINVFSGVEHGFAVRGNSRIKAHCYAKDQAFLQAVAWFDCFLEAAEAAVHM